MDVADYFALGLVVLFVALMIAAKAVDRRNLRKWEQDEASRVAEQILRAAGWPEDLIRPWAEPAPREDAERPDTSGFVKVVELDNGQSAIAGIDDPEPEVTPKALPCPHGSRRWVQFEKDPNGGLRHAYHCRRSACPPIWVASTPSIEKETKQ